MKATIGGITYDTDTARKLAHKPTPSSDEQLYQSPSGEFFLLVIQAYVDGQKLGPNEVWFDLGRSAAPNSRLRFRGRILPLRSEQALRWCIRTQVPVTLRGYLLDCL